MRGQVAGENSDFGEVGISHLKMLLISGLPVFQLAPAFGQVQDDPPSGAAQDSAVSEDRGAQRGWLTVSNRACGLLKLGEQVEEQQNALEGGLSCEELL